MQPTFILNSEASTTFNTLSEYQNKPILEVFSIVSNLNLLIVFGELES